MTHYRASANASYESAYDEFPHKDELRGQLVTEQRGLCAFCGGRIVRGPSAMKIAHWNPRKLKRIAADGTVTYPNIGDQLSYWNILGCCNGNYEINGHYPPEKQHCDTHQGNKSLSRNPSNPDHRIEEIISYLADGSIVSSDSQFNQELGAKNANGTFDEGVLNLNLSFLRTNRKQALNGFKDGLAKRGRLTKAQITRLLTKYRGDAPGELDPYSPVIAYWLKKRLEREA